MASSTTGETCTPIGTHAGTAASLHVLRLCSVFEPSEAALRGHGRRFDPIGGMQSHTGQLTRTLARFGVDQTVLTTRPPGTPRIETQSGVRVLRFGAAVPWARQGYAIPAASEAWRLAKRADLVHAHVGEDIAVLPVALAAARRAGIPLVVTVHCSVRHTYVALGLRGRMLAMLGGAAEAVVLQRADRVIALTPRLAACLCGADVPAERIRVIPSGVAPELFVGDAADPFPHVPRPRVLFVGRLHRQKGVGVLLEAGARMRTGAQVVFVGDGPERRKLCRAGRRLGLGARLHVTGFVAHRAVPAAMRHADVLAVPSLYEELGTVLLEAMQAGLPIVASCTGGIPDAAGDAAALVPPGDPAALAAAIDEVLTDCGRPERLVAAGRERVRRFDWAALAHDVLDVYAEALAA